jgi:TPR repeat protein
MGNCVDSTARPNGGAASDSADAFYDLGIAYSVGRGDTPIDLVQAHKWFNLAAMAGLHSAQEDRADIASAMSTEEIAAAQRAARDFLRDVRSSVALNRAA